ncbi:hypothetical protein PSN13_03348 [Micromonospora saelicesensis]|uniref:Tyr recombinase domain-containing protein n=2 Tax=Micromonospora saelicesensis TaxID=285676 RepID=A0A328NS77_9ACTN|nr:hypothetical protein PSN13_03348 [Micromonospora saelicesensis]
MHILRHTYASVLLDAGESIKALSTYLGHADPGFTLRTYTHLLPTSEDRTRRAIDTAFGEDQAAKDGPEAVDGLIKVQRPSKRPQVQVRAPAPVTWR